MENELANAIKEFGFPIVSVFGMGYFIFFIWKWVTEEVKPVLGEATSTLIKLVDRVRMLDNDMIRLNTKLAMVLEYKDEIEQATGMKLGEDLDDILRKTKSQSEDFNSTGD